LRDQRRRRRRADHPRQRPLCAARQRPAAGAPRRGAGPPGRAQPEARRAARLGHASLRPVGPADLAAEIAALPKRDTPSVRAVRRRWSAQLKSAPAADVLALAAAYEAAAGQGGKWVAYELIRFHKAAFAWIDEAAIEDYASRLSSWGAVDAF